jgi:hypothetical protein
LYICINVCIFCFVRIHSHDVGAFFRECQSAPVSLQSFNRPSGIASLEIGSQLEQFEKDLEGYDDLVQSLGIGIEEGGKQ